MSYGGHLASISDSEENAFVYTVGGVKTFWIGGVRPWSWTDGTAFVFTNWNLNEPNNAGGVEYCVR